MKILTNSVLSACVEYTFYMGSDILIIFTHPAVVYVYMVKICIRDIHTYTFIYSVRVKWNQTV